MDFRLTASAALFAVGEIQSHVRFHHAFQRFLVDA
jgi:hypothetical protein